MIAPGRVDYRAAHQLQQELVEARARGAIGDTVIVCEHDPVFTVGRRRDAADNVLDPGDTPVIEVERGGDVTWHGPGQLVVYPILSLEGPGRDLHAHMHRLEDLMIDLCGEFGLIAGRDPRNTGVWHQGRKLGSVGIACRRWVTWHGLSLNVDPDLQWFGRINPCGFDASIMTSLSRELGRPVSMDDMVAAAIFRVGAW